ARESSIRPGRLTFSHASRHRCHARADDAASSQKRDDAHHRVARSAAEARCSNEKSAAADRFADDENARDHGHPDTGTSTETAAANRSNPNAIMLDVARSFSHDFDSSDLELSFLKPWKTQGQSIWTNRILTAKSTAISRCWWTFGPSGAGRAS